MHRSFDADKDGLRQIALTKLDARPKATMLAVPASYRRFPL